jgi:hypothetical protein
VERNKCRQISKKVRLIDHSRGMAEPNESQSHGGNTTLGRPPWLHLAIGTSSMMFSRPLLQIWGGKGSGALEGRCGVEGGY